MDSMRVHSNETRLTAGARADRARRIQFGLLDATLLHNDLTFCLGNRIFNSLAVEYGSRIAICIFASVGSADDRHAFPWLFSSTASA